MGRPTNIFLCKQEEYRKFITGGLLHDYFGGSVSNLVPFCAKEDLSAKELDEILRVVQRSKTKAMSTEVLFIKVQLAMLSAVRILQTSCSLHPYIIR